MKCFIWTDEASYTAFAHCENVTEARRLLRDEIGGYDGSCPEREKARKTMEEFTPSVYLGRIAGFRLSDSAEVRELEKYQEKLTAERDHLRAEVDRLRGERDNAERNWKLTQKRATKWALEIDAATARAEAAEGRAAGLCRALCDTVKASGGVARDGLSDEFLILGVPAEMAARKKAQKAAEHTVAGLRRAGQAVVDRWDSPKWKDQDPTAKVINELRAALAASSDEHARRIKSEALLEMANRLDKQCCECHDECIQDLLEEADRLESEATNG